jgi:hypothetical protein
MARKATRTQPTPVIALTRWREAQRIWSTEREEMGVMTITDAARAFSKFAGRPVAYQVWWHWERGGRIPDAENMRLLHDFTQGQVRADHFYHLGKAAA